MEGLGQVLGILCPLASTALSFLSAQDALGWGLACACCVFGAVNSGGHLCAKQHPCLGSSHRAVQGISQRKTPRRVSVDFQGAPTEQEGTGMLWGHHRGIGHCWGQGGRTLE